MDKLNRTENGGAIRSCGKDDIDAIFRIVNAAAEAYRDVIPRDCWHVPYMPMEELLAEVAAGVEFVGYATGGNLAGIMGIQQVKNVWLIRHAYVLPAWQGHGVGSMLLTHLRAGRDRPLLIGTWRAAHWAIGFYQKHGFGLVPQEAMAPLLRAYWQVPDRQIKTSVVLASPDMSVSDAARLMAAA